MNMQPIFDLNPAVILLIVIAVEAAIHGLGRLVLAGLHRTGRGEALRVPVAPFVVAGMTPWALLFGFLTADVWSTNRAALESAHSERAALQRLEHLARPEVLGLPPLVNAVADYRRAVQAIEWGERSNVTPAREVERTLLQLWAVVARAARDGLPAAVAGELVSTASQLERARSQRLAIGAHHFDAYKWLLIMLLGLLVHVVLAAIHRDRPQAGRLAMTIFSGAVIVCIWGLALHASPYAGGAAVKPASLFSAEP
jgi:hypothetical protein